MKFRDVTEQAGLRGAGYDMGAAVGDYDNDGRPDLFVAGVNRNTLYHNRVTGILKMSPPNRGSRTKDGLWRPAGSITIATAKLICGSSTTPNGNCPTTATAETPHRGIRMYCHPKYFQGLPAPYIGIAVMAFSKT